MHLKCIKADSLYIGMVATTKKRSIVLPMSEQKLDETLAQIISHVMQRITSSKAGDKDALLQEYGDWIQCLGNPYLISKDILFINTLTFKDKYFKD